MSEHKGTFRTVDDETLDRVSGGSGTSGKSNKGYCPTCRDYRMFGPYSGVRVQCQECHGVFNEMEIKWVL